MPIIWPIFGPILPIFWADAESLELDLTAFKPEWSNSTEVGRPVFALTTVPVKYVGDLKLVKIFWMLVTSFECWAPR